MNDAVKSERLFTGYTGRLFLSVSFGWLMIQLGRQLLPPLLPTIVEDLAITSTQAGFALTLLWGLYALCQYPSGRFSDKLSRKTLLSAGLSLLTIGFLIINNTKAYPAFLIGSAVVGLGAGLYPTAARALVSDLFVDRRGQAFGIHTALGDLGNAAAAGVAVAALVVTTWQTAFLPVVSGLVVILIVIHLWDQESYALTPVDLGLRSTGYRLFEAPRMRWLLVAYALYAFTWQSITGFLPTFLQAQKGFSIGLASTGFATFFIIGTLIKPASGLLGDRFGRPVVAVSALGIGITGLVSMLVAEKSFLIFLGIIIFAVGLMAFPPVMQAYFMDIFPAENMGGDLGAMRTIYIGFGSIGPTYIGYVADIQSYTWAFAGLVICMLVSAGVVTRLELFD